jgi:excisionase family DNA binding protein
MAPTAAQREIAAAEDRTERALMDAEAAAIYLDMSEEWVRKAARLGTLPSVKVGTSLKFRKASLDEWIAAHEREAEA